MSQIGVLSAPARPDASLGKSHATRLSGRDWTRAGCGDASDSGGGAQNLRHRVNETSLWGARSWGEGERAQSLAGLKDHHPAWFAERWGLAV